MEKSTTTCYQTQIHLNNPMKGQDFRLFQKMNFNLLQQSLVERQRTETVTLHVHRQTAINYLDQSKTQHTINNKSISFMSFIS